MNNRPTASIIINNYNYGRFLSQAIDSALKQTYPHTEVIVVDDGSIDESRDIIQRYGDRIVPILKENGGQASTFNAGYKASNGEYIFLLDADDIFLPEKVETVISLFERFPQTEWCFHSLKLINEKHETVFEPLGKSAPQECDFRHSMREQGKLSVDLPATSGLCFRRSLLQEILPMPEGKNISIGDHYLKFTATALSKGVFIEKNLAQQIVHGTNAYTLQSQNQQMKARILVLAAYWIRYNFPTLSKFTNSLFARGISAYWRAGGVESDVVDLVKRYFNSLSRFERFKINSRAFYRYLIP